METKGKVHTEKWMMKNIIIFKNRLNLSNKNIFIKRHPKGAKLKEIITKKRIKIFAEKISKKTYQRYLINIPYL